MRVNKRQLSEIMGVTEQTLTNWQNEGLPVAVYAAKNGLSNEYETGDVVRWFVQKEISRLQLEKPRDRLDRVKAELAELERDEKLGQLAPAALFERAWNDHILAARTEFLTMPDILATELSALAGVEIDPDVIALHINRALEKLANYGAEDDSDDSSRHDSASHG